MVTSSSYVVVRRSMVIIVVVRVVCRTSPYVMPRSLLKYIAQSQLFGQRLVDVGNVMDARLDETIPRCEEPWAEGGMVSSTKATKTSNPTR